MPAGGTAGGWTNFNFNISSAQSEIFKKALAGLLGVGYTPLAVATQVVAGTNYCFLSKATVVVPDAPESAAKVYIFQPLKGEPHLTDIATVKP